MPTSRWTRSLQLALIPIFLLALTLWSQTSIPEHLPDQKKLSEIFRRPFAHEEPLLSTEESPLLTPGKTTLELEDGKTTTVPPHLIKSNPAFHLLVTDAKKSPALCKTLLSAAVLDYPPPTLIGYNDAAAFEKVKSNDIIAVHDFLERKASRFQEHDVVLVVDGRSSFFQLPSSILLHRFETARASAQRWAADQYGSEARYANVTEPKFSQKVLMSASDSCALGWTNSGCEDVPESPVKTGKGNAGSGPNHADSGATLGLMPDVKKVFEAASRDLAATKKADQEGGRSVMAKLFGEQELSRRSGSSNPNKGSGKSWRTWVTHKPWTSWISGGNKSEAIPGDYEYGMALDYSASLFMTPNSDGGSLQTVRYDDFNVSRPTASNGNHISELAIDLATAPPPIRAVLDQPTELPSNFSSIPFNASLDTLATHLTWDSVPLLTNSITHSVPALLHLPKLSKNTPNPSSTWDDLWFHGHARALLRNYIRSAEGPGAIHRATVGGDMELDTRGGKGGFWTADDSWLDFTEVCSGFEDEIFGDGHGPWGQEGGPNPRCNINGQLISGEGDCAKIKEEEEHRKWAEIAAKEGERLDVTAADLDNR